MIYDIYVSQNQFRVQKTQLYTLDDFLCRFENFWKFQNSTHFLPTFTFYSATKGANFKHILLFDAFFIIFTTLGMAKKVICDRNIVRNGIKHFETAQKRDILSTEDFFIAHQRN